MNIIKGIFRLTTLFLVMAASGFAAKATDYDLPAVGGYDLVSYQQESGPVRGSGYNASEYDGVTYLFATESNKQAFEAAPEKFLPAYNGFCAFGVSVGQKFNTDPTVYELVNGVLYLNLDAGIQKKWAADIDGNIKKADANWKKIG